MTSDDGAKRQEALRRIRSAIESDGRFIYVVSGGDIPRFAYTIGVSEHQGFELILAGAAMFLGDEVLRILNTIDAQPGLVEGRERGVFQVEGLGTLTLRPVHESWARLLILGAFDYYGRKDVAAVQVVPERRHWTIDIPDMSQP